MVQELNKRQLAYCYWRARSNTIEQSMQKAGYTCKGASAMAVGSRLQTNVKIQERIEYETANIFSKSLITEEYVLDLLHKIAKEGKVEANRVKAGELLGKYLAMWKDRAEITQKIEYTLSEQKELNILNSLRCNN